jgi:aerobic-type carbon monoxide dehydrogenase small subunit (CoxS/CutS family)
MKLHLIVNGQEYFLEEDPFETLKTVLIKLGNISTESLSCLHGCRGDCFVSFNGEISSSCMIPALNAHDSEIETVEKASNRSLAKQLTNLFEDKCKNIGAPPLPRPRIDEQGRTPC